MDEYTNELERQENFPWHRSAYHEDYNEILANFKVISCLENMHGDSVLDLACGDGQLTLKYADKFKRIVGVDASNSHLEIAKKNVPKADFHHSLIEDFETDEKFDNVLLSDIIEHVIDPQILLKKAAGFLKQDGVLIIHAPNAEAINRKIAVIMGSLKSCHELSPFDLNIAGHRRTYTLSSLIKEVEDAGLVVEKSGGIFFKILSTAQMDWFLKNGLWEEGGFGWGRVGGEKKDWKLEFCRACYEIGRERPEDCNVIYVCVKK